MRESAPKQAFPRQFRIKTNEEFQQLYRNARRFKGAFFTILAITNDLTYPRLGVSISKKNIRSAVARNRIKRIVRESFRQTQHNLQNLDIVVVAHRGLTTVENPKLRNTLDKQWEKLIAFYQQA